MNIFIRRDNGHVFDDSGGHQQTVKRVAVEKRQGRDMAYMFQSHANDFDVIWTDCCQKTGDAPGEFQLADAQFYGDFPDGNDADIQIKSADRSSRTVMTFSDNWPLS